VPGACSAAENVSLAPMNLTVFMSQICLAFPLWRKLLSASTVACVLAREACSNLHHEPKIFITKNLSFFFMKNESL
jgi:hypothetical protein